MLCDLRVVALLGVELVEDAVRDVLREVVSFWECDFCSGKLGDPPETGLTGQSVSSECGRDGCGAVQRGDLSCLCRVQSNALAY